MLKAIFVAVSACWLLHPTQRAKVIATDMCTSPDLLLEMREQPVSLLRRYTCSIGTYSIGYNVVDGSMSIMTTKALHVLFIMYMYMYFRSEFGLHVYR